MKLFDVQKQVATVSSTATITLGAAVDKFRTIAQVIAAGNLVIGDTGVPFFVRDPATGAFEAGKYTITNATLLTRESIISSSNNNAAVAFGGATVEVFNAAPGDYLSGMPLADYLAANDGGAPLDTDVVPLGRGSNVLSATFSVFAAAVHRLWPKAKQGQVNITSTAPFPLDYEVHHRRLLVFKVAAPVTAPNPYTNVGDGFESEGLNISGADIPLSGMAVRPSGSVIPAGASARFKGANGTIYVDIIGAAIASAPDTTAPILSSPTAASTGTTTGSGSVTTNEGNGTLYYLATANATETAATIKASGATQVITSTGSKAVTVSGLSATSPYYLHFLQRDAAGNESTVVNSAVFTTATAGDTTAPTLSSPTGTQTGQTTATGTVSTNEANGTLYYYISTNAVESAATVKAANLTVPVTATGVQNISTTGLTAGTTYYAHYVHRDAAGNDSTVANSASFTTASAASVEIAPFTATARGDFPTAIQSGGTNYLWHDVVPNAGRTETVVSVVGASSTSNTVPPTQGIGQNTTPQGNWLGAFSTYQGSYIMTSATVIPYPIATPVNMYLWLFVTDNTGKVWTYLHTDPIIVSTNQAGATTSSATPTPQWMGA